MPGKMIRKRARFAGRVQGVGFRFFCVDAARRHAVRGWVRNCPDGSVELEAEQSQSSVLSFLEHVRTQHSWARVDDMVSSDVTPRRDENEGFDIRS